MVVLLQLIVHFPAPRWLSILLLRRSAPITLLPTSALLAQTQAQNSTAIKDAQQSGTESAPSNGTSGHSKPTTNGHHGHGNGNGHGKASGSGSGPKTPRPAGTPGPRTARTPRTSSAGTTQVPGPSGAVPSPLRRSSVIPAASPDSPIVSSGVGASAKPRSRTGTPRVVARDLKPSGSSG